METNKIRLLIADDNLDLIDILKDYIELQLDIEVVGIARNGIEALNLIKVTKPDVVLLDIIMPHLDGLGVLEKMNEMRLKDKPVFIILSAVGQDKITQRAISLGAEYYIVKPFDIDILVERIRQLKLIKNNYVKNDADYESKLKEKEEVLGLDIESKVTNILREIGMPAHIKGYQYIREAIILAINDSDIINSVTKKLYPSVANYYNTTSSRVERSIRNAVEISWSRGNIDSIDHIFGYTINLRKGKPTNSEFIAIIADKIRLSLKKPSKVY